jgi:hypothetical protein
MQVDPMIALVFLGILAALAVVSLGYGVDSRDGSTDPRRPVHPVGIR